MAAQARNARLNAQEGLRTAVLHRHATIFERRAAPDIRARRGARGRARMHAYCIRPFCVQRARPGHPCVALCCCRGVRAISQQGVDT